MKIKEIRNLSSEELATELERLHRHLFEVRAQAVTEKLEDSTLIEKTRHDIARILTVQRERHSATQTTPVERK
jgi:large subunit ribosomal protein L29